MTPLETLLAFAEKHGLHVTSTFGGQHVPGSLHYLHRAIDVSTHNLSDAQVEAVLAAAHANQFRTLDERRNPNNGTPWSGPHLHISDPPPGWTGGA
jgi:hypothetical protein